MTLAELLDLEHQGWKALCDGTAAEFYGQIMTDDSAMVLAGGLSLDRQGVIDSLGASQPWQRYDISEERIIRLGEDEAILLYTGRASRDDGDEFAARMASVYTRRVGTWRLVHYQQTPID
ncbi:nuclear transport factor 2 family protein [Salinibacterium sp. SYSU T00001]|uniref:nuclear transport factor 2 family protein n=1 Tax=Homoserinimonas sedimenticola TaxID=2986805 RepID=UPI002236721C|nr:nuclear transport factor 2 family protein [Salinibacterium sedimenticola]MCW4384674.1 nuclear transport factor 2 family protein [Salinibacterium sedimenticola]